MKFCVVRVYEIMEFLIGLILVDNSLIDCKKF